ncbi:MAG: hypothetical protein ACTSRE_03610 [Promethearchaeota archaeon]
MSENKWNDLKSHFLAQGESLKIRKKMFCMYNKERFIAKLLKGRVTELIDLEMGLPYDPGNGKIMKEWVIIPSEISERWIEFASEAKEFVKKNAK